MSEAQITATQITALAAIIAALVGGLVAVGGSAVGCAVRRRSRYTV